MIKDSNISAAANSNFGTVVYKMKEETDFNDVHSASKLRHIMILK